MIYAAAKQAAANFLRKSLPAVKYFGRYVILPASGIFVGVFLVLLFVNSSLLSGIVVYFFPPSGYIYLDSPEVYTRERLINERLSEEAWLTKQLDLAGSTDLFTASEER